ncbi:hypothetical protein GE21DRAFT_1109779 [Neurospora crassa]|nr:hypothetical protein GE21DRAFT_1109779 [Neurospora crassa]
MREIKSGRWCSGKSTLMVFTPYNQCPLMFFLPSSIGETYRNRSKAGIVECNPPFSPPSSFLRCQISLSNIQSSSVACSPHRTSLKCIAWSSCWLSFLPSSKMSLGPSYYLFPNQSSARDPTLVY